MNREIKFRAWVINDLNPGTMYYPEETGNDSAIALGLIAQVGYYLSSFSYRPPQDWQKEIVFQQFTGLKDKNGKEIYEGDIAECKMLGFETHIEILNAQVKFYQDCTAFGLDVIGNDSDYRDIGFGSTAMLSIEVIGNIYETPELLTTSKATEG